MSRQPRQKTVQQSPPLGIHGIMKNPKIDVPRVHRGVGGDRL